MAYIGKSPSVGIRDRFYYTTVGGETSISGADNEGRSLVFTDGKYVDVKLNGITLVAGTDYITTTTNTISGLDTLGDSDVVEVVVYDVFSIADTVSASRGGTFEGPVTFNDTVTFASLSELSYVSSDSDQKVIDTFSKTAYRGAEYLISVEATNEFNLSKILVVHDNTTAYLTQYGEIGSDVGDNGTFDAAIDSSTVTLLYTPSNPNSTITINRQLIDNSGTYDVLLPEDLSSGSGEIDLQDGNIEIDLNA
jgi:hypothetical protein